jgi:hypothetical protein
MHSRVGLAIAVAMMFAALTSPARAAVPDGGLVRTPDGRVSRIVGGAPLWISSCAYTNNCAGLVSIPNFDGYAQYPADGALANGGSDGGYYRFAGGAPLWVGRCDYGLGCANLIQIDDNAFRVSDHLRQYPKDSTVIRNVDDGGYYRIAGGAALLVRCDIGTGCVNPPQFDAGTFVRLGSVTPGRANLRSYPADGTTLTNADDGTSYRVAGGAPLPVASAGGGVIIDNRTLLTAGTATPSQPHLRATPDERTLLVAGGTYYRIAGEAAVALTDCSVIGGCDGAVPVDPATIASLGGGRLRALPKDGTVLRGLPSKRLWEIVGGHRRETFIAVDGIDVDDGALEAIATDAVPAPAPLPSAPPTIAPAPAAFAPVISSAYRVDKGRTRFTALGVRDAPNGSRVVVKCAGKGCPYKSKRYAPKKGRVDAARDFRKARLRNGAKVTVTVTGPTGAVKAMSFRIRGNKLPVRKRQCAPPGGKLVTC